MQEMMQKPTVGTSDEENLEVIKIKALVKTVLDCCILKQ